jgi:hypothetical protein
MSSHVSINDVTGPETESPFGFVLTVGAIVGPSNERIRIGYKTVDGSAQAGADYVQYQETVHDFGHSNMPQHLNIPVQIISNPNHQANRTFRVELTNHSEPGQAVVMQKNIGRGVILDSNPPRFSVLNAPRKGHGVMEFEVWLSGHLSHEASVHCYTEDGTAHAPGDYGKVDTVRTFPIGKLMERVQIGIVTDNPGQFTLKLKDSTGAQIGDGVATGTIE